MEICATNKANAKTLRPPCYLSLAVLGLGCPKLGYLEMERLAMPRRERKRFEKLVDLAMSVFQRGHRSDSKDHVIHIETPTETIHYEKHPAKKQKVYFSQLGDPEDWSQP